MHVIKLKDKSMAMQDNEKCTTAWQRDGRAFLDQQTVVAVHLVLLIPVHIWAKWQKTRQKLNLKNIFRLINHTYA